MPLFDYQCEKCKIVNEVLVNYEDNNLAVCNVCGGMMVRLFPTGQSFKLIYNNQTDCCSWGNEGYSSSQYWSEVKAAKARGENVKGANEE
jgi:putative FmdB family regulatory protein